MELSFNEHDERFTKLIKEKEDEAIPKLAEFVANNHVSTFKERIELETEKQRIADVLETAQEKDKADRQHSEIDLKALIKKKSRLFHMFGFFGSIQSLFMSCAGLVSLTYGSITTTVTDKITAWVLMGLIVLIQCSVICYARYSYALHLYHHDKAMSLNLFRWFIMAISTYCNYISVGVAFPTLSEQGNVGNVIQAGLAISPDIISNLFSSTSTNMRYQIYNTYGSALTENQEASLFEKMRIILFGWFITKIDIAYKNRIAAMNEEIGGNEKNEAENNKGNKEVTEKIITEKPIPEYVFRGIEELDRLNLKVGDQIKPSKINLSTSEWNSTRYYLEKEKCVKCENKTTYLTRDIEEIKQLEKFKRVS